jgi:hypothetical protein
VFFGGSPRTIRIRTTVLEKLEKPLAMNTSPRAANSISAPKVSDSIREPSGLNYHYHLPTALSTPRSCQLSSKSRVVTTDCQPFSHSLFFSSSSHSGVPFVDTNILSSLAARCSSRNLSSLFTTSSISIQHRSSAYWTLSAGSKGGFHWSGRMGRRFHPSNSANVDIHSQSI